MKPHTLKLILVFILFSCKAFSQVANSGRGMYVNRFFRTTVNATGATVVDPNYSTLSIAAKEDSVLQYAKDNHITYLILYDLYYVFGNTTFENYLCTFIDKAKTQFCIEKIGVASSCASLFDNIDAINATPALSFTSHQNSSTARTSSQNPLRIATEIYQPGDSLFYLSEATKFNMRASAFNSGCNSKIDALVTEYEFWNTAADDCLGDTPSKDVKFQRYQSLINYIDIIRDDYNSSQSSHQLTVESYIGYLNQGTTYSYQQMADWMDGSYNGKRRIDRIIPHYYGTDATTLYSRVSGQNVSGYYSTRFLALCQPTTSNNTKISPLFSSESTYWGAGSSFLSTWFNASPANNIFTAERSFYNDWYADANTYSPAVVGSATLGNIVEPGNAIWFTSNQMSGHLNRPLLFSSNSPICVASGQSASFNFTYQGPIEQGVSFQFYLTTTGTQTIACGSTNTIAWPAYNGSTQTSINLNAALGSCNLPVGDYDAHLVLNYSATCGSYIAPIQKVSITTGGKIVAQTSTTACQGNPVYLIANSTGGGTTTYAWYDGNTAITGATSQTYVANPASTGTKNYSCKITSSISGCTANRSNVIPVTINAYPAATITVQSSTSCASVLKANPTGGTYSYSWSDGSTSQNYTASKSGSYSVAVTQNGCTNTARYSYQNVSIQNIAQTKSCYGASTGSLEVNLYWGTFPYSLSWSGPASGNLTNLQPGHTIINNLPAGTYTVTVTSAAGCTRTLLPNPIIEQFPQITYNANVIPSTCSASTNGSITLTNVSGGDGGPFTYNWQINNSTLNSLSSLLSGNYVVTINDATLCSTSATIHVPALQSTVNVSLGMSAPPANTICSGTTATFNALPVNGGTTPLYQWKVNGLNTGITTSTFSTDQLLNGDIVSCTMTPDQVCASANPVSTTTTMTVTICPLTLNLNLFIEGYYLGASTMRAVIDPINYSTICDTITIELRDTSTARNLIFTSKKIVNTNGSCYYTFTPPSVKVRYYVVIKHRNSLETWSSTPILFSGTSINFSFANSISNSFSNNTKDLGDGNFAIISGDADQNGVVDLADNTNVINAAFLFYSGYKTQDLTGDNVVESADFSVVENNIGRMVIRP